MNSEEIKTSNPQRPIQKSDKKKNLNGSVKFVAISNLSI